MLEGGEFKTTELPRRVSASFNASSGGLNNLHK